MIRSVIFDMDGTLLDTLDMIAECNNKVFKKYGFPERKKEEYRKFVGDGMKALMLRALPQGTNEETVSKLMKEVLELYHETGVGSIPPYDGITELLDELVKRGILISILTNKEHKYAILNTETILGKYHFETVIGDREGKPLKPAPDGVFEISDLIGISLNETVFVGDMKADILTGKNAKVLTAGCLWGFGQKKDLEKLGADILLNHPMELIGFIDGLC
jgi:phosphoglycolate phosphatase